MEVENLVGSMRNMLRWFDEQIIGTFGRKRFDESMTSPIQLNPDRTIATAAKILARENPELAGALMQVYGKGAKPYEVEE